MSEPLSGEAWEQIKAASKRIEELEEDLTEAVDRVWPEVVERLEEDQ